MKIGSWFHLGVPKSHGQAPEATGSPASCPDGLARLSQDLGLGQGFSLGVDGKVTTRDWLGRQQSCTKGQALEALASAVKQGRLSPEELKLYAYRYPQAALLILGEPSAPLARQLDSWEPAQRKAFTQLLQEVGADYRNKGESTFFLGSALEKLALNGKLLESRDELGHSLLENLLALREKTAQDGYAGQDLFAWTLIHSAYSKHTFHQAPSKGVCAAATLGYVMWQENPSKMVGALNDWVYQSPSPNSHDPADPVPFGDQVMQAHLMNLADPDYTYNLVQDRFTRPDGQSRERGLFPEHQKHLLTTLSDRDWHSQPTDSQQLREHLRKSPGPLPVALEWKEVEGLHSRHLLCVSRINDEYVYLRDPAGEHALRLENSSQEIFASGFQRMSREEFDQRLQQGLIPE